MAKESVLYDLVDVSDSGIVLNEIKQIIALTVERYDPSKLEMVYADIVTLFKGEYPGYRASNTKYHDLEHTNAVALAAARLIHGCTLAGMTFEVDNMLLGVYAALFHDVGLIQTKDDKIGSGAKYTVGHEKRSIVFMRKYLSQKGFTAQQIEDCSHLIMCTILNLPPKKIPFRSPEIETLGKIVGTADLMAQIADRYYLEKLLLLFQEFQEAGVPDFATELDLLKKTEGFYKNVAKQRLAIDFSGISANMTAHFKQRWGVEKDLYSESIQKNIDYLRTLLQSTDDNIVFVKETLRRGVFSRDGDDTPES
jgi:HD superfamily phosphodiesterase